MRGIAAAIAAITAVGISLSLGLPLLSVVLAERGVPTSLIGINTAMSGLSAILITPFVTPAARRFGTARLLIAVLLVGAVSFLAFYFVQPFWAWFPLRFFFHASLAAAFVLSEFWINALAPPERRGMIMGIYATVLSLGFASGPLVLSLTGFEGIAPFLAGTAMFLAATLPVIAALSASPVIDAHERASFLPFLVIAPMATLAAMVFGAVESGSFAILTLYGIALDFSERASAGLITAVAIGNLFFQIPLGLLADRVDKRFLLIVLASGGLTGTMLMPLVADDYVTLVALIVLWGGTIGGMYTVGLTHLGSRFTGASLASANAAFVMMYSAGSMVGPATIAAGLDIAPPHGFAFAAGLFFAIYLAIAAFRLTGLRAKTRHTTPIDS